MLPDGVAQLDNFICEVCTVRAVCEREIEPTGADRSLLMLERMRIVDLAKPRKLDRPPTSNAIPLMWVQEQYALHTPRWKRNKNSPNSTIKFATVRGKCCVSILVLGPTTQQSRASDDG
jgi:hypothetical protein